MQPADEQFLRNVNTPADIAEDKFAAAVQMTRVQRGGVPEARDDLVAREEPLEIRVMGRDVAVVMRTPGHDRELAAGFLLSEGVVRRTDQIVDIIKCPATGHSKGNIVDVIIGDAEVDWDSLTRHVFSASSCGLLVEDQHRQRCPTFPTRDGGSDDHARVAVEPRRTRCAVAQATSTKTGGLHACAIFDSTAISSPCARMWGVTMRWIKIRLRTPHDLLPFDQHVLFLSGRVSFEMVLESPGRRRAHHRGHLRTQQVWPWQFAAESNQTLVGFLRDPKLNIYTHDRRIIQPQAISIQ